MQAKASWGMRAGCPVSAETEVEALLQSGERQPTNWVHTGAAPAVSLATVWPEMLARVPDEDRRLAERALMVPLVSATDEDLCDAITIQAPEADDFVIVTGVVLKETTLADRAALELLGPGDVLAPRPSATHQLESRAISRYLAHGRVALAAIDARFRLARKRWPGIAEILQDCLGDQAQRTSAHIAMLHQPRVEDRLIALFADLAERFGRVTADGILVDVPLTHDLLGGLVASRRPTVTLALQSLASTGVLGRLPNNRWKLAHTIVSEPTRRPVPPGAPPVAADAPDPDPRGTR